jgi:hypothetical protein
MEISNELLAAYAKGNISESERKAVRQYLSDHPELLESVMIMMDEDYDVQLEDKGDSFTSHSFDKELDNLLSEMETEMPNESNASVSIFPFMSKAAQNTGDNLCVIRCEGYALRTFGVEVSDKDLEEEAEKEGWLSLEGIPLNCIGKLAAKHGLGVSRNFDCTINNITKALKHGDIVIAVIDNTELKLKPQDAKRLDLQYGKWPNHAVIIQSVDINNNSISLLNPGKNNEEQELPLDIFIEAWNDSINYLIISNNPR